MHMRGEWWGELGSFFAWMSLAVVTLQRESKNGAVAISKWFKMVFVCFANVYFAAFTRNGVRSVFKSNKDMWITFKTSCPIPALINIGLTELERFSEFKLRGVYVQNDLKWNTHVSSIISKACKRIHFLRVCRTAHLPRDIGLTTYITKIRPVLEYASPVWGGLPIYLEEDLQRVQNRCLNVIGLPRDTVESLVTRRQNLTRKEFKHILESEAHPCKSFLEKPVDHGHNLRSCKTNPAHPRIPVSRTVRHKHSFIPRGAKLNLI